VFNSEATTRGIRVRVRSRHLPERSAPEQGQWFFIYTVEIANLGPDTAKLVSRHWIITDANGVVQEVRGPAIEPSLVTWPTRTTGTPVDFARATKRAADSRT